MKLSDKNARSYAIIIGLFILLMYIMFFGKLVLDLIWSSF